MTKQRHITTQAIILKTNVVSEINKNFSFISPRLGIHEAIAYGGARIKSRFCSIIQPFIQLELFLYHSPRNNLFKLEDAAHIELNDFITADLKLIYLYSYFAEILLKSYLNQEDYRVYYTLLDYCLQFFKTKNPPHTIDELKKIFLFFSIKYMLLSGYQFYLLNCKECQCQKDHFFFEPNRGGIFCENHSYNNKYRLNRPEVEIFRLYFREKYDFIKTYQEHDYQFNSLYSIIIDFFNHLFDSNLKSSSFLNLIFK